MRGLCADRYNIGRETGSEGCVHGQVHVGRGVCADRYM